MTQAAHRVESHKSTPQANSPKPAKARAPQAAPVSEVPTTALAGLDSQAQGTLLTSRDIIALQGAVGNAMVQRMIQPRQAIDPLSQHRAAHEPNALQLASSRPAPIVQRKPENEKALSAVQGLAMYDLLPKLEALSETARTDEEAGGAVGGPRLVTAMRAVKYKVEGKAWSKFADEQRNELVALKYEDQISDVLKFLGAKEKQIKSFLQNNVQAAAVGWKDVKSGANAGELRVGNQGQPVTAKDEGIRRLPLQITSSKQAVVLISSKLDPTKSIDVLLHLHGHNAGYAGSSLDNVRDVQKDQIEQQLMASGQAQRIAILPQGSTKSDFPGVDTDKYVSSVFIALNNLEAWGKGKDDKPIQVKPEGHGVILSAHSGGGAHVSDLLDQGRKPVKPAGLKSLFLFDSINAMKDKSTGGPDVDGSTELRRIRAFVAYQLDLELKELDKLTKLKNGSTDPDQNQIRKRQLEYLEQSGFRVQGYFTPGWYAQIFAPLVKDIADWFKKQSSLDSKVVDRWSKNYVVQSVNAVSKVGPVGKGHLGHDYILGQGTPAGKSGKDYDPSKGGALQNALGTVQPRRIIQRDSPSPALTDAQQWEQDWNSHPGQQHFFAGSGRPTGTSRQRYDVLCPLYKAHGIPRPMIYMASSITTAKFYHFSTPAHSDMATALAAAETTLTGKGFTAAPAKSVWALNPRTTSKGGWSNHADGKAVDIDPDDNPHLVDEKERKIISLVSGVDMEKGGQGYDVMKGASDQFKADYNPAGLQRRITELKAAEATKETERDTSKSELDLLTGQRTTLKTERGTLTKELKSVPKGNKATADDIAHAAALKASLQQKDADIKQVEAEIKQKKAELKKKEAELKEATKNRELIEKQLTTYQATEKAIADLETSVKALPDEIKSLEDQVTQSKQDEQDAKQAKDSDGVQAQKKLRARLQQTLKTKKADLKRQEKQLTAKKKQRDADPLRQYAAEGFLNLSKDVVEAMTGAGLKWGGNWKGAKDFMHFEL